MTADTEKLKALALAASKGPWRWELNHQNKCVSLVGGRPTFDKTVMDFARWGLGGAAPRFNTAISGGEYNIMERVDSFGAKVPGREHHGNWFMDVGHPDAQWIAAANPAAVGELIDENDALRAEVERLRTELAAAFDEIERLKADPLYSTRRDADRWRFRKQFLASGGAIMFSASGCQLRRAGELVASGATEEEAIDAATRRRAEGGNTSCLSAYGGGPIGKIGGNDQFQAGTAAGTEKDAMERALIDAIMTGTGIVRVGRIDPSEMMDSAPMDAPDKHQGKS